MSHAGRIPLHGSQSGLSLTDPVLTNNRVVLNDGRLYAFTTKRRDLVLDYGLSTSKSGADNYAAIQAALADIANGGLLVVSEPGTYNIDGTGVAANGAVFDMVSNTALRIDPGVTLSVSCGNNVAVVGATGTEKASTTLAAAATMGSNTLSLSSATGFAIGDTIAIVDSTGLLECHNISNLVGTTVTTQHTLGRDFALGDTVKAVNFVSNVAVFGGGTLRQVNGSATGANVIKFVGVSDAVVHGITIANNSAQGRGILFAVSGGLPVRRCQAINNIVTRAYDRGIEVYIPSYGCSVVGNLVQAGDPHTIAIHGTGHNVVGNVCVGALGGAVTGVGIHVDTARSIAITGNSVQSAKNYGINLGPTVRGATVVGNVVEGCPSGIRVMNAADMYDITIAGNDAARNTVRYDFDPTWSFVNWSEYPLYGYGGTFVLATGLTLKADAATVGTLTANTPVNLATGNQETGQCGLQNYEPAATGVDHSYNVNFKTVMTNVPTSITLTAGLSSNLATGYPKATNASRYGFRFTISNAATGSYYALDYTYTTVGN